MAPIEGVIAIAARERVALDPLLALVDAIVELDDHGRRLEAWRHGIALRLHRLGHLAGIARKFESARLRRFGGHKEETLALRGRHRLVARDLGRKASGAGRHAKRRDAKQRGGRNFADTHVTHTQRGKIQRMGAIYITKRAE
jgi:hypothetical protein